MTQIIQKNFFARIKVFEKKKPRLPSYPKVNNLSENEQKNAKENAESSRDPILHIRTGYPPILNADFLSEKCEYFIYRGTKNRQKRKIETM